jgi:hypothetical protein
MLKNRKVVRVGWDVFLSCPPDIFFLDSKKNAQILPNCLLPSVLWNLESDNEII